MYKTMSFVQRRMVELRKLRDEHAAVKTSTTVVDTGVDVSAIANAVLGCFSSQFQGVAFEGFQSRASEFIGLLNSSSEGDDGFALRHLNGIYDVADIKHPKLKSYFDPYVDQTEKETIYGLAFLRNSFAVYLSAEQHETFMADKGSERVQLKRGQFTLRMLTTFLAGYNNYEQFMDPEPQPQRNPEDTSGDRELALKLAGLATREDTSGDAAFAARLSAELNSMRGTPAQAMSAVDRDAVAAVQFEDQKAELKAYGATLRQSNAALLKDVEKTQILEAQKVVLAFNQDWAAHVKAFKPGMDAKTHIADFASRELRFLNEMEDYLGFGFHNSDC